MKKFFRILGLVLIVALFAGTILFLYHKSMTKPEAYGLKSPFISNVVEKTVATGSIVPRQEIDIKPQVSGIIDKLYVEPGDRVKKDQVIARIKIIPDMVELNSAESRVNKARINFDDAQIEYDRQKKLYDGNVISFETYKEAKVAYDAAKEEQDAAENNLELIKNGVTLKARNATNTLVRSTINGMVLDVPIKEGNSVIQANTFNDGTSIATIADMNDMIFEGNVDETEVGKIKLEMPIELEIGALGTQKFDAILKYIAPKGTEDNGAVQFQIKADILRNHNQFIRAGYSANATIVLERRDSVMVVPEGLLEFDNDSAFVQLLVNKEENKFKRQFVQTGLSDGINIQITDGLKLTDQLKTEKTDNDKKKDANPS